VDLITQTNLGWEMPISLSLLVFADGIAFEIRSACAAALMKYLGKAVDFRFCAVTK